MKNIHLIPTDKPSRLFYNVGGALLFTNYENYNGVHIYITSNEEIKEVDWYLNIEEKNGIKNPFYGKLYKANQSIKSVNTDYIHNLKKIILTTDQDLINDGVQVIDDEFLEWFVKNPSCEEVEVADLWKEGSPSTHDSYQIIIPKEEPKQIKCYCGHTTYCDCSPLEEPKDVVLGYKTSLDAQMLDRIEPKQETLEEDLLDTAIQVVGSNNVTTIREFLVKHKWQQERSYSEEEVKHIVSEALQSALVGYDLEQWFTQFRKK